MGLLSWVLHNFWALLVLLFLALVALRIAWRIHKYGATRVEFVLYLAAQSLLSRRIDLLLLRRRALS